MTFKEMLIKSGMDEEQMAAYLGIPFMTVWYWANKSERGPKDYVAKLIEYKLKNEKKI